MFAFNSMSLFELIALIENDILINITFSRNKSVMQTYSRFLINSKKPVKVSTYGQYINEHLAV